MAAAGGCHISGLAFLCFADEGSGFQGLLVTNHGHQYALIGKESRCSDHHIHQCCMENDSLMYTITVIDHTNVALESPLVLKHVLRKGGDNCSLESQEVEFRTDQLIADKKAEEYIQKYFTSQKVDADSYVCIGNMKITVTNGNMTVNAIS